MRHSVARRSGDFLLRVARCSGCLCCRIIFRLTRDLTLTATTDQLLFGSARDKTIFQSHVVLDIVLAVQSVARFLLRLAFEMVERHLIVDRSEDITSGEGGGNRRHIYRALVDILLDQGTHRWRYARTAIPDG